MSVESPEPLVEEQLPFPNADYQELSERASAAGYGFSMRVWGRSKKTVYVAAELAFPCGSGTRVVSLAHQWKVKEMLAEPFENYRLSATYQAFIDTTSGGVEVGLLNRARMRGEAKLSVWDLPGVQIDDDSSLKSDTAEDVYKVHSGWRLVVASDEVEIELSPKSSLFEVAYPYAVDFTLKIKHAHGPNGPRADDLLEEFASDFLLDLELQYGLGLILQRWPGATMKRIAASATEIEPRFPSLRYSPEASALYWYGTSAVGLPLLQFLAYYQVLEFFFSSFTRRAVVERLRTRLKHPRFDMRNDTDINALIEASRTAHAGLKNELDQLRHTLSDCITPESFRTFIRADEQLSAHLLAAKSRIRGADPLRLDAEDDDLIRQIADRVYRVRNRIVHTKAGAEEIGLDLLLPSSSESDHLWADVVLVRWLAQNALVHGALPR